MQPPHFWRELKAEFQALPDPVWQSIRERNRLQGWDGDVVGGDASLRAHFRQLAKRGGVGLGAEFTEALGVWLNAIRSYLEEEQVPWLHLIETTTWMAPPTVIRRVDLSMLRPQEHRLSAVQEQGELASFIEAIQHGGLHELLIVVGDEPPYVVLDDAREHLKYRACVTAEVTEIACGIRHEGNRGTTSVESTVEIDCLSVGSVQLCTALETQGLAGRFGRPKPAREIPPEGKVGGPNLGAWLTAEMERRDFMTDNRLHAITGLDRKTIKNIRAGNRVASVRIRKLADGLGLSPSDIPTD